jgi:hypothetical protein
MLTEQAVAQIPNWEVAPPAGLKIAFALEL